MALCGTLIFPQEFCGGVGNRSTGAKPILLFNRRIDDDFCGLTRIVDDRWNCERCAALREIPRS